MIAKAGRITGNRGVTLIELLVVIAIIAILSGITMMSANLIRGERLRAATQTLLADLQKCRTDAMTIGPTSGGAFPNLRGCGIRFNTASSYVRFKFNDQNGNYQYDDTTEELSPSTQTLPNVQISPIYNLFIFDRFGFPRLATSGKTWEMMSAAVITLSYPGVPQVKCIQLETISIREGLWNGTTCDRI